MSRRYALIDADSGYVWWVGDAESPEAACTAATLETGGDERTYQRVELRALGDGYRVYEAPAGFDVDDGQNRTAIERVEAMPFVGRYHAEGARCC